jgi:hypothetical protein
MTSEEAEAQMSEIRAIAHQELQDCQRCNEPLDLTIPRSADDNNEQPSGSNEVIAPVAIQTVYVSLEDHLKLQQQQDAALDARVSEILRQQRDQVHEQLYAAVKEHKHLLLNPLSHIGVAVSHSANMSPEDVQQLRSRPILQMSVGELLRTLDPESMQRIIPTDETTAGD